MCGISCILRFAGDADDDLPALQRMHMLLQHRGPDGEGALIVSRQTRAARLERIPTPGEHGALKLIAAVRRLRVSDLRPEADQPIVSEDGRTLAILNGAIYNYREIAAALVDAGHTFHTASDTEVVLEAYRHWGPACFERFNGMWAILIVDLDRRLLIGSRDRLGIKPLYYSLDGDRLLLASEPRAVAAGRTGGPSIGSTRFFEFLSGYPPQSAELSFFGEVHPVPAASWFAIDLQQEDPFLPEFRSYWNLADFTASGPPSMSFPEAAQRYEDLLTSAVAGQSLADARVGSLLSGGLDTSTIVTLWAEIAKQRGSQRPDTCSIVWDDPQMSERPYSEAVAEKAGSTAHFLQLSPREVWRDVDDVVRAQGQPLLGQELIAQYNAYRLAREHGDVVVLDGSGSDEVQAGLFTYEAEIVYERLIKGQLIDVAREVHALSRAYGRPYRSIIRSYVIGSVLRHWRKGRVLPTYDWLDERSCARSDPGWERRKTDDFGRDPSFLNRTLYRETKHTNVPAVLMYSDRNAMAHSVEARFPYLDHRLVELCFSLPAAYKVGFGKRKRLLLETSKRYLPPIVLDRKDKKYFVLLSNWMPLRTEHAGALREASRNPSLTKLPYVNAPVLHAFVDDFLAGRHQDAYAVWRIYTASRWLDIHGL